jgi:starch phosphorylase
MGTLFPVFSSMRLIFTAGADEPETREALDLIFNDHFSRNEPGIFEPIRQMLLHRGDYYMHLADLNSYLQTQGRVSALYPVPNAWSMRAIINVACSRRFSNDRTIREYAAEIWHAKPSPVD